MSGQTAQAPSWLRCAAFAIIAAALSARAACAQTGALPAAPQPQTVSQLPAAVTAGQAQTTPLTTSNAPPPDPKSNAVEEPSAASPETVFPHTESGRYWISGQVNIILQGHAAFPARYSGPNSFTNWAQSATTHVLTLYTGYQLTHTTEVFGDMEYATGRGVGNANGMAGYVNLDSVRLVQGVALSTAPYLARLMVRQIIPLSKEQEPEDRDPLHMATSVPARRLEFRVGKFDLTDFFDVNTWGSDSHLQFMNWTVDNNGAYDYAANTRGYTDGGLVEYDDHWWTVRFATALMPKIANGINLNANLAQSRAQNLEFEARGNAIAHRAGTVRLLGYMNQANMGNYEQAIHEFLDHATPTPDIIATRQQGRRRYGFGLNFEQSVSTDAGIFGRLGWSDGRNESYCYTEDDRTAQIGAFSMGRTWHRPADRVGAAFVVNGIVAAHQQYLALGGLGFLLGDGALTYGHEKIVESFYTAHLWRGFFVSADYQHVNDPGYNQDRGPVSVWAGRFHTDF
jgi:high affinity Mn2+ porin